MSFSEKRHVVGDGHVRIEGVVLEHHGDVALLRRHGVHHPRADQDLAAGDGLEPRDHAQQRRLPAAGRADEDDEFPVRDVEGDAVQHLAAPKLFSTWRIFTEAIGVFSRLAGIVTAPPAIATAASRLPRFREQDEFPLPADEGAGIGFGEAPAPALVEAPRRRVVGEAFEGRRAVGLRGARGAPMPAPRPMRPDRRTACRYGRRVTRQKATGRPSRLGDAGGARRCGRRARRR